MASTVRPSTERVLAHNTTNRQCSSCVCAGVCCAATFCATSSWTTSSHSDAARSRQSTQITQFSRLHYSSKAIKIIDTNLTPQQATCTARGVYEQSRARHNRLGPLQSSSSLRQRASRGLGSCNYPSNTATQPAAAQDPPSLFATYTPPVDLSSGIEKQYRHATSTLTTHNIGRSQPS